MIVLKDCIANTINITYATKGPVLREDPYSNSDSHHTIKEPSLTGRNETNNRDNEQVIVDKIVRHVTENGDTKYVDRW